MRFLYGFQWLLGLGNNEICQGPWVLFSFTIIYIFLFSLYFLFPFRTIFPMPIHLKMEKYLTIFIYILKVCLDLIQPQNLIYRTRILLTCILFYPDFISNKVTLLQNSLSTSVITRHCNRCRWNTYIFLHRLIDRLRILTILHQLWRRTDVEFCPF